jgi:hypothetical protein
MTGTLWMYSCHNRICRKVISTATYSGGYRFEYLPEDQLTWLRFMCLLNCRLGSTMTELRSWCPASLDVVVNYLLILTYRANSLQVVQQIVPRLVKFFAFHETQRFITAFTRARHLCLSRIRSAHFAPSHPVSWRFILISFHRKPRSSDDDSSSFPHHNPAYTYPVSHACYMPQPLALIWSSES